MSNTAAAAGRDPRVQRMIDEPVRYFAEARKEARKEAEEAARREAALRRRLRKGNKRS